LTHTCGAVYNATRAISITHCNFQFVAARTSDARNESPESNTVSLTPQRRSVFPEPNETFEQLVRRVFPNEDPSAAQENLKSWNLHIFLRRPPGLLLGSDVVFVEAP